MNLSKKIAGLHIQAKSYDRIVYSPKPIQSFKDVRQVKTTREYQKPKGLWYACDSNWKKYVQEETNWADTYKHKYLIEVGLNRMCVIRTEKQLLDFHDKYGIRVDTVKPTPNAIDWVAVSNDYDGIEICPYQWNQRDELKWYYVWDVASGCIWRSSAFKGVKEVENDIKDGQWQPW